jgi:hypothetical protein
MWVNAAWLLDQGPWNDGEAYRRRPTTVTDVLPRDGGDHPRHPPTPPRELTEAERTVVAPRQRAHQLGRRIEVDAESR